MLYIRYLNPFEIHDAPPIWMGLQMKLFAPWAVQPSNLLLFQIFCKSFIDTPILNIIFPIDINHPYIVTKNNAFIITFIGRTNATKVIFRGSNYYASKLSNYCRQTINSQIVFMHNIIIWMNFPCDQTHNYDLTFLCIKAKHIYCVYNIIYTRNDSVQWK